MQTNTEFNIQEIKEYLDTMPMGTKLYLGCDSVRYKKLGLWYAAYTIVLVVHRGGNAGCKIFGKVVKERDFDQKKSKPSFRLMNEVYKVSEFYLQNFDMFETFADNQKLMEPKRKDPVVEIHLDINPNEEHGSSCVITQATGYIKSLCGIDPKVKPVAFGASYAADRFQYIMANTSKTQGRRKEQKRARKA
jgi:predicted RNase H-related nuclease YkuK (DUF458 family)